MKKEIEEIYQKEMTSTDFIDKAKNILDKIKSNLCQRDQKTFDTIKRIAEELEKDAIIVKENRATLFEKPVQSEKFIKEKLSKWNEQLKSLCFRDNQKISLASLFKNRLHCYRKALYLPFDRIGFPEEQGKSPSSATKAALLGTIPPPWIAVLLHEGSTLVVGLNSLRLLKK